MSDLRLAKWHTRLSAMPFPSALRSAEQARVAGPVSLHCVKRGVYLDLGAVGLFAPLKKYALSDFLLPFYMCSVVAFRATLCARGFGLGVLASDFHFV